MKSFNKLSRHYTFATCCFNNFNVFWGFEYFSTFLQRVMQITKTNPSRYNSNCSLLREKLLLQESVHIPHFDLQVLRLRPLENLLYNGSQQLFQKIVETLWLLPRSISINFSLTLVLFMLWHYMKSMENPLKNSLWSKRFLIKLSKHYGYRPGRFQ